jgi:hypothetical protein
MASLTIRRFRPSFRSQIKPINDSHALSVGADLISQSFVLSSALGLVLLEYYRSSVASAAAAAQKKEEKEARQVVKEARLAAIETRLVDMDRRLAALEQQHQQHGSWLPTLPHLPTFGPFAAQQGAAVARPAAAAGAAAVPGAAQPPNRLAHQSPNPGSAHPSDDLAVVVAAAPAAGTAAGVGAHFTPETAHAGAPTDDDGRDVVFERLGAGTADDIGILRGTEEGDTAVAAGAASLSPLPPSGGGWLDISWWWPRTRAPVAAAQGQPQLR